MTAPLMPRATAVWLVENTTLTFKQIADFANCTNLKFRQLPTVMFLLTLSALTRWKPIS